MPTGWGRLQEWIQDPSGTLPRCNSPDSQDVAETGLEPLSPCKGTFTVLASVSPSVK